MDGAGGSDGGAGIRKGRADGSDICGQEKAVIICLLMENGDCTILWINKCVEVIDSEKIISIGKFNIIAIGWGNKEYSRRCQTV